MNAPRIGSLFSGAGMLDEGVRSVLGGSVAWHSEVDPAACKVLAHRYPDVPNLGDVTAVDWSQVEPVDVITGGSPCQDVSHAGKRAGMRAGTRSGLWAAMVDAIDILRPAMVVWENVRGVLSAEADSALEPCAGCVGDGDDGPVLRALGRVLGDLADLGYDTQWHGLRAADVGAPHGRFRVFVVAVDTRHGTGSAEHGQQSQESPVGSRESDHVVATDAERVGRDGRASDTRRGPLERVATARTSAGTTAYAANVGHERRRPARDGRSGLTDGGLAAADAACDGRDEGRPEPARPIGRPHAAERSATPTPDADDDAARHGCEPRDPRRRESEPAQRRNDAATDADRDALRQQPVTEPRRSSATVAGHARADSVEWGQYGPAIQRWERTLGRVAPPPTETGPKGGQRLSPRFTEWMMGWPDGWVTDVPGVSRNDALKICGNGVVWLQAAEALRRILATAQVAAA